MERRLVWAVTFSLGVCAVTYQRSLLPWAILVGMSVVGIGLSFGPRPRLLPFFIFGAIWGNSAYVLDQVRLKKLFTGEPQRTPGLDCDLHADVPWVWNGVTYLFLRSLPDGVQDANDRSCVLSIKGQY